MKLETAGDAAGRDRGRARQSVTTLLAPLLLLLLLPLPAVTAAIVHK